MAQLLRFDGIDDRVTGNAIASIATADTLAVEVDFILPVAAQNDTKMYRVGTNGPTMMLLGPQSTGTVRFWMLAGGTIVSIFTPVLTSGVRYTIRAVFNAVNGATELFLNGVSVATGTRTGYTRNNIPLTRFIGTENTDAWNHCRMDLYGLKEFVNGVQVSNYDPSVSSGTVLVDTVNAQNGTIVGGASFVYYNSITATTIPNNTLGAALNQACAINLNNYFIGATSYSVLSGSLPTGLSIVGNEIVGTPTTAQSTQFVIRASNSIDTLDSATITFNTGLWYLAFDGVDERIDTPLLTMPSNFEMEIDLTYYTAANDRFFFSGFTAGNAGRWYIGAFNNVLVWRLSGSYYFSTGTTLNNATRYKIKLIRSGDNFTLQVNGSTVATRTQAFTMQAFSRIGSSQDPLYFTKMDLYSLVYTDTNTPANNRYYDPNTSGGVGNLLIDRVSNQNGTQAGTWPADNSEWVNYAPAGGGDSFAGTIGKTSLSILTKSLSTQLGLVIDGGKSSNTLSNKTLDISSGYSSTVNKSTSTVSQKQFSVSVGTVLGVGKQTLVVSDKQESAQLGYVNTLSKLGYTLATKQLAVVVGANLPFIGVLNKTTYSLSAKQLGISVGFNNNINKSTRLITNRQLSNSLGWSSGVTKQSLSVVGKQESANLGYSSLLQKLIITLNSKPLSVQVGTAIPFVGLLNKLQLNAVGKPLSVSAGTSIPFLGLIGKTSLLLSGKVLDATRGQYIEIVPSHLPLITKLLSIGEVVYPVIPKRRVYGLNDKIRLYIMRR